MNRRKTLKLFGAAGVAAVFGVAAIPEPSFAQDQKKMVTVVKIAGIPWFNALENGVKKAGEDFGIDASTTGPPHLDPAQQVKLLEDLVAKLVLSGTPIVDGVEIPGLGKAIVDVDGKQSKVEKTMIVNKDRRPDQAGSLTTSPDVAAQSRIRFASHRLALGKSRTRDSGVSPPAVLVFARDFGA